MTTQITVRLPEQDVQFIDELVRHGEGTSRAAVVSRAIERERRRKIAERDIQILLAKPDRDLEDLAQWAAKQPLDLD